MKPYYRGPSYPDVAAAATEYILGHEHGRDDLNSIRLAVVAEMKLDRFNVPERVFAQVYRALQGLVSEGRLIKVTGSGYGNEPTYYTPLAHDRMLADREAQLAAEHAAAERWAAVAAGLEARGYEVLATRGHPVSVSLEAWERLLNVDIVL
jgi:hypothetical protein